MKEQMPLRNVVITDTKAISTFAQEHIPHSYGAVVRLHLGGVPMTLTVHLDGFWQIMIGTGTPLRDGNLGSHHEAAFALAKLRRRFYKIDKFRRKQEPKRKRKKLKTETISLEEAEKLLR